MYNKVTHYTAEMLKWASHTSDKFWPEREKHACLVDTYTVKPGNVVTLERADGVTRDYEVSETRILSKPKLLLPPEDGRDRLILVTCWPFDAVVPDTQKRFSVLAERIR